MRIALIGHGKMGRAVEQVATTRGHAIAAIVGKEQSASLTRDSLGGADVAVEFSVPEAAVPNALACVRSGVPVVVGTTGWTSQLATLEREVQRANGALLWAPNFSIGVQLLAQLVEKLASLTPEARGFALQMIETHHAAKKDAPSGTAAMLAKLYTAAAATDIPITSVRIGHVPGRHEIIADGQYEQLRLVHEARDRRVFADGAVTAAEWLAQSGRRGVFTLRDVLSSDGGGR
ncbi:MAG TPA: dihydrodipicolinate reductase C-terminal domain-containing protein [Gemmatimonadaceae bacterium]|nr:dihydrodipicolinate reductase C-terminal domain-containing protein [Gemmatimonadaceae bacterium]